MKKTMAVLTAIVAAISCITISRPKTAYAVAETARYGDVNRNGEVDVNDVIETMTKFNCNMADMEYDFLGANWLMADVDGNGEIDLGDAILILEKFNLDMAGIPIRFPVESMITYNKSLYVTQKWVVWYNPNINSSDNFLGELKPGDTLVIKNYMGDSWYEFSSRYYNGFINIPDDALNSKFFYEEAVATTTTTTAATTTTTSATTKATTSTTTSTTTTTSATTKATTSEATTTYSSTTTTFITTTESSTTTNEVSRERFSKGDYIRFTGTAWSWYYIIDDELTRAGYLTNDGNYYYVEWVNFYHEENDCYILRNVDTDQLFMVFINDTKYFEKNIDE